MHKITSILAVISMLAIASCSDKTEYVPATPDPADCMGVYFDGANEHDFVFIPGESANIEITLKRLRTDVAADVPLIASASADGIVLPSVAHFEAGSESTTVTVDCNSMPLKQQVTIRIDVPDEYINHYAETLFNYQSTALMSEWVPANLDGSPVKFYFTEYNYTTAINPKPISSAYQPIESDVYVLPGSGLMRIDNFLNSGIDMVLSLSPSPYADFLGFYRLSPMNNNLSMIDVYESDAYGDDWYNAWFLVTDPDEEGEEDYATAYLTTLDGNEDAVEYPRFYWYSDSYAYEYSYANLKSASMPHSSASIGFWGMPTDPNVVIPDFFYVFFTWDGETGL